MKKVSLFLLLLLAIFSSCRQVEYIEVPKIQTVYKTNTVHDSVDRWHTHYEYLQGDTVVKTDTFYRATYHFIHDTTAVHDTTVRVDNTKLNEAKEKFDQLNKSLARSQAFLTVAIILILVFASVIAYLFYEKNHR